MSTKPIFNTLLVPESGFISFSNDPTGSSLIPSLSSSARIVYSPGGGLTITSKVSSIEKFAVEGRLGRLFSVTDAVSGVLFELNDVSGFPLVQINDYGDIITLKGGISSKDGTSQDWKSVYTTVQQYSGTWDDLTDLASIANLSADWNTSYTWISSNSARFLIDLPYNVYVQTTNDILRGTYKRDGYVTLGGMGPFRSPNFYYIKIDDIDTRLIWREEHSRWEFANSEGENRTIYSTCTGVSGQLPSYFWHPITDIRIFPNDGAYLAAIDAYNHADEIYNELASNINANSGNWNSAYSWVSGNQDRFSIFTPPYIYMAGGTAYTNGYYVRTPYVFTGNGAPPGHPLVYYTKIPRGELSTAITYKPNSNRWEVTTSTNPYDDSAVFAFCSGSASDLPTFNWSISSPQGAYLDNFIRIYPTDWAAEGVSSLEYLAGVAIYDVEGTNQQIDATLGFNESVLNKVTLSFSNSAVFPGTLTVAGATTAQNIFTVKGRTTIYSDISTLTGLSALSGNYPGQFSTGGLLIGQSENGPYIGGTRVTESSWQILSGTEGRSWNALNAGQLDWYGSAMSSDGRIILVGGYGNYLSISYDYGATWKQIQTGNWAKMAMSVDGRIQTATEEEGYIWTSYNYGKDWTRRASSKDWSSIAMSSDGKYQAATTWNDTELWLSRDYGATWTSKIISLVSSDDALNSVAMSSDGRFISITVDPFDILTSSDFGETWSLTSLGRYFWPIKMSSNGRIQITAELSPAEVDGRGVWVSYDYGTTWNNKKAGTLQGSYIELAISSDGRVQIVSDVNNGLFISRDYGVSWVPANTDINGWYTVCMSSDGRLIIAGSIFNNLYRSQATIISPNDITILSPDNTLISTSDWSSTRSTLNQISASLISTSNIYAAVSSTYLSEIVADQPFTTDNLNFNFVNSVSSTWGSVAMSKDGKYQLASSSTLLYASNNFGKTWVVKQALTQPCKVAVSLNGEIQIAVGSNSYVTYLYGTTWNSISQLDNNYTPVDVAVTGNGWIVYVCTGGTQPYHILKSTNLFAYNEVFSSIHPLQKIECSQDGKYVTVLSDVGIYYSSDYGVTWNLKVLGSGIDWRGLAVSKTGRHQVANTYSSRFITDNFGIDWREVFGGIPGNGGPNVDIHDLKMSEDGRKQIVHGSTTYTVPVVPPIAVTTAKICVSEDYGSTWREDPSYNLITGSSSFGIIATTTDARIILVGHPFLSAPLQISNTGLSTSSPLTLLNGNSAINTLTVVGAVSTNDVIYARGGNSDQWNSTFTTVRAISSRIYHTTPDVFNAATGSYYLIDTTSTAITAYLPANPAAGDNISFADAGSIPSLSRLGWSSKPFTINRNSNMIEGRSENLVCDVGDISFSLTYIGGLVGWKIG